MLARPAAEPAATVSRSAADAVYLIAAIGSPLALVAALLFYFGWVRAAVQANELGYDPSVMDLSTTDYILKSIYVLFLPLVFLLVIALALHSLHRMVIAVVGRSPRRQAILSIFGRCLELSWLIWTAVGIALLFAVSPAVQLLVIPLGITLALACALYGRLLQQQVARVDPWSSTTKVLVIGLLALAVFWDTERVARLVGEGYAADIASDPRQLIAVTVYSAKSLGLSGPGISETRLDGGDSKYLYRYSGLRLLQRSGDRFFFINERWDRQRGRVFVLRDTDDLRMEFSS